MNAECPIQKTESQAEMRLEWDNRNARKDRFQFWFFVFFWIVWAPLTVFATFMIFLSGSPVFFSIWCIFGWVGTLGIPYALLQRTWSEWLDLSPDSLVYGQKGLLAPKPKSIPTTAIYEIGIGHYESGDPESVVTLNVHYLTAKKRKRRRMVGYWLHPSLKERLYCDILEFSRKHQLPMTFRRY